MIRHVVVLSFLASLFLAARADAVDDFSEIDVCTSFSLIAKDVMIARQKDKPMSQTLPLARDRIKKWADKFGFGVDLKEAEEQAAQLVMAAYDRPSYGSGGNAQDQISDFENDYFKECYKGLTSDED